MVPLTARVLLLAAFVGLAAGHFNLINPKPYSHPLTHCKRNECHGLCPPLRTGAGKSSSHPSVTWRRGQKVDIAWQRNNHVGGYYRRSLVPVKHMFNSAWHEKTAFEWGCQSQNRYQCAKKPPKGKPAKKGRDYYTCAYVRIRGGPLAGKHVPTFVRGSNPSKIKPGTCESTSARVGECAGFPCHGKPVRHDVPAKQVHGHVLWAAATGKELGMKGSVTYKMKAKQFQVWSKHLRIWPSTVGCADEPRKEEAVIAPRQDTQMYIVLSSAALVDGACLQALLSKLLDATIPE
eukprot:IDg4253t1